MPLAEVVKFLWLRASNRTYSYSALRCASCACATTLAFMQQPYLKALFWEVLSDTLESLRTLLYGRKR